MRAPPRTPRRRVVFAALALALAFPSWMAAQFPTEPPPPSALRPLQFPQFQETTLPNGLGLLVVENHELPVVSLSLAFPAGTRYDPSGREGLADLVAELLTKGTPGRTADQIAVTIEGVGSSLSASADPDFLLLGTTVLTEHLELALDLVGDVVLRSTFPDDEVELARTRKLSELRLDRTTPEAVADAFFLKALYGSHPYGRRASESTVKAVAAADLRTFAQRRLRPRGALLVLAGDIDLTQARALAGATFGTWKGAPPADAAPPRPPAARPTSILLVHRPASQQSNVLVGNLAQLPGDSLYDAAVLANRVLGGGTDSRLFMILREQKSWTYGAYSRMVRRRDRGYFRANMEVRTAATDSALGELMSQLRRIRSERVPDAELAAAKGYLVGSFPRQVETPQQIATQVTAVRLLGLGRAHLTQFRERLAVVTAAVALRAARRTIRPDSAVIVIVGDAEALHERLRAIGPVRMVDVDGNALELTDISASAGPLPLDGAQMAARRDSFRIVAGGAPRGSYVAAVELAGDSIAFIEHTVIPDFVDQRTVATVDAGTFAMRRSERTGVAGGQDTEARFTYADGRVSGHALAPQQSGTPRSFVVDTAVPAGTIDDNALALVIPALPLATGATFRMSVFSTSAGTTKQLTARVASIDTVTVPAGTFNAFAVELAGMQVPMVMYVTRETPRRVVKIDSPIVYELVR